MLLLTSLVFFFSYFYLHGTQALVDTMSGTTTHLISNQPDEMATYFFIKELVMNHSFGALEFFNASGFNQVHPRSMTVIGERLEPIGFPFSIIIVALFSWIPTVLFGLQFFNLLVICVVPILAVVSNFLVYGMVRKIWNERMAFISGLLLYVLPPWWYWASHPFQHAIPFVFAVLLAMYGIVRVRDVGDQRMKVCFSILSALGISLALALRPNELVWVTGLCGFLAYRIRSSISKQQILAWTGTILLVALLFFVTQDAFYSSPFASGYVKPLATGEAGNALAGGQGVSFFHAFLFPFGIHLGVVFKTIYRYFFFLFNPWTLWAFVSVLFVLFRGDKLIRNYFIAWILMSVYLLVSYGSWNFVDNLVGLPSIGSSQVRYFMPIYVGMIPLIAYFCDRILSTFTKKRQVLVSILLTILFLFSSRSAVYLSYPEGLTRVKQTLVGYESWQTKIYSRVPKNGIVVTRYADKYIFPGRKVIIRTSEEIIWVEAVKKLSELNVPIWWHDLKLSSEEQSKVDELLGMQGFKFGEIEDSWNDLELRRIVEK